jgi:tRNA A37 threonylcarbamoyltransferase TsaD
MRKGSAYNQKMEYQKKSYNARYVLLRSNKEKKANAGFSGLQRYVLSKLRQKYKEKEVKKSDVDNLVKYISIFKFLKEKFKKN